MKGIMKNCQNSVWLMVVPDVTLSYTSRHLGVLILNKLMSKGDIFTILWSVNINIGPNAFIYCFDYSHTSLYAVF